MKIEMSRVIYLINYNDLLEEPELSITNIFFVIYSNYNMNFKLE